MSTWVTFFRRGFTKLCLQVRKRDSNVKFVMVYLIGIFIFHYVFRINIFPHFFHFEKSNWLKFVSINTKDLNSKKKKENSIISFFYSQSYVIFLQKVILSRTLFFITILYETENLYIVFNLHLAEEFPCYSERV